MAVGVRRCGMTILLLAALLVPGTAARAAAETAGKTPVPAAITPAAAPKPERLQLMANPDTLKDLLAQRRIAATDIPTPHWVDDGCPACHRGTPAPGHTALRDPDINRLCKTCHDAISGHNYIHAVGMVPSTEKRNRMNEDMRQAIKRGGDTVTCISCHDLKAQCLPERAAERAKNPRFFRGGPFPKRNTLCFACHDPSHYERMNPHDQISDEGELKPQVCLVCHDIAPNRREVKSIDDVSFNIGADLTKLCAGCHVPKPHPAQADKSPGATNVHLTQPSPDVLQLLRETEAREDLMFPLDPGNGQIFCATCHNPHERGVQVFGKADRGADSKSRLRDQGACAVCHNL